MLIVNVNPLNTKKSPIIFRSESNIMPARALPSDFAVPCDVPYLQLHSLLVGNIVGACCAYPTFAT